MKLYKINIILTACLSLLLYSCKSDMPVDTSRTVISHYEEYDTDFDNWLKHEFLDPYNIQVQYRFIDNESNMDFYLSPASIEASYKLSKLVKEMCLQPYDSVTGSQKFIRRYFPKQLNLTGSRATYANGTRLLGVAEGGCKIFLFELKVLDGVDSLNYKSGLFHDINDITLHTIHHEFTHIQNQTKPYDPSFKEISGKDYTNDTWNDAWKWSIQSGEDNPLKLSSIELLDNWYDTSVMIKAYLKKLAGEEFDKDADSSEHLKLKNKFFEYIYNLTQGKDRDESFEASLLDFYDPKLSNGRRYIGIAPKLDLFIKYIPDFNTSDIKALRSGFISPYASKDDKEDVAELQAFYITDSRELWEAKVLIAGKEGGKKITDKMNIIKDYLSSKWQIDIDKLRDIVQEKYINANKINLKFNR